MTAQDLASSLEIEAIVEENSRYVAELTLQVRFGRCSGLHLIEQLLQLVALGAFGQVRLRLHSCCQIML